MKKRIHDETGALNILSTFIMLAVTMLMSFVLLAASVQINCINIRNAAKMELNNISARRELRACVHDTAEKGRCSFCRCRDPAQ